MWWIQIKLESTIRMRPLGKKKIAKLMKKFESLSSEQVQTKLPHLVFYRELTTFSYKISLRENVIKWMFNNGIYFTEETFQSLNELDRDFFQIAWSTLAKDIAQEQLYMAVKLPEMIQTVWSYICNSSPNLSTFHLLNGNTLDCHSHSSNLDYLLAKYTIEDSNIHGSLLTKTKNWKMTTDALDKLKLDEETLLNKIEKQKQMMREQEDKLREYETKQTTILNKISDITSATYWNRVMGQPASLCLRESFGMMAHCETPLAEDLNTKWKKVVWCFQSCSGSCAMCSDELCFTECDEKYQELLKDSESLFWKQHSPSSRPFSIQANIHSQDYLIMFETNRTAVLSVVQRNLTTNKERKLKKNVIFDIWSSIVPSIHVVPYSTIQGLINQIGATFPTNITNPTERRAWYNDMAPVPPKVEELFWDSKSGRNSMRSWCRENKKNIVLSKLQCACNPGLVELFLFQQRNLSSSLCLFGFHGTSKTHSDTVVLAGVDPRYSQSNLFLGQGAYVSQSSYYCHVGNYSHLVRREANGSNVYELLIVCFLPGKPYHESKPTSPEASQRRIAPPGSDSVTCITNETRIWALYDRSMLFPLYKLTYTVT